ncbi:MAG TPA: SRPBCC domain-containing protein [Acidimicrobiia bacterium]
MPSGQLSRTLEVAAGPSDCWSVLTDVHRIAGWVTIAHDVSEIERLKTYTVVLQDKFGPFKLHADMDVEVTDVEEEKRIRFRGSGTDRSVGTTISVDASMSLTPTDAGTTIQVEGSYQVVGTVASMGSSTIKKKADTIVEEFFEAAERELS